MPVHEYHTSTFVLVVSEDSKSSDEEFAFSDEEDDGLEPTAAVDHYESLVSLAIPITHTFPPSLTYPPHTIRSSLHGILYHSLPYSHTHMHTLTRKHTHTCIYTLVLTHSQPYTHTQH